MPHKADSLEELPALRKGAAAVFFFLSFEGAEAAFPQKQTW